MTYGSNNGRNSFSLIQLGSHSISLIRTLVLLKMEAQPFFENWKEEEPSVESEISLEGMFVKHVLTSFGHKLRANGRRRNYVRIVEGAKNEASKKNKMAGARTRRTRSATETTYSSKNIRQNATKGRQKEINYQDVSFDDLETRKGNDKPK